MTRLPFVLFGVPIDSYSMAEAFDRLAEFVRLGRLHDRSHQVATVNVDFLVNALADPEVMGLLQGADLNLADGMPLVWASRLLGAPLPERVAGADLVPLLAEASAALGWRIHLFGAAPGVADRARAVLLERHPTATITSDVGPPIDIRSKIDDAVVASIRAADPDVLCVALGNPKQERFIATYKDVLRCPVMIGVGGSLDMIVGDRKRAPQLAQRIGAEWIFRAVQEPGRLGRRYAHDIRVFGPEVVSHWNHVRTYRDASSLGIETDRTCVRILAGASIASLPALDCGAVTSIEMDLEGVERLAPQAHALVISTLREARLYGIPVTAGGIGAALRTCLENYGTWTVIAAVAGP